MASVTSGGNPITVNGNFLNIANVVPLSTVRNRDFHGNCGVDVADGPLDGLTARGVLVARRQQQSAARGAVRKIKQDPNYDAALV